MYWQTYFTQYFPVIVVVVDIVCHIDNGVDSGHNKTKKAKGRHPVLGHTFCLRFLNVIINCNGNFNESLNNDVKDNVNIKINQPQE